MVKLIYFDKTFRRAVLTVLATVPDRYYQRIDGLRCEPGVVERDWWFFRYRLRRMERAGLIDSIRTSSWWPSCDGMPAFRITEAGHSALRSLVDPPLPES